MNSYPSTPPPVFLLGATGTGKSAAALELARAEGGRDRVAILVLDAMQVYRDADIGTSKPTRAEQAEIPHGGMDLVDFGQPFDVAQYLQHAATFLRIQREAGRRVLIVGGTGLYFRALTRGLCEAPQGPDALRADLSRLQVSELRQRLGKIDPAMLERIDTANPRRLIRAIEVIESTGRSLRSWQDATPEPLVHDFTAFCIQRDQADLHARIEARLEAMFAAGWIEEVESLVRQHGLQTVRNFAGIGYRPMAEALSAGTDPAQLKSNILVSTRQYAKRQLTWFAREPNLIPVMLTGNPSFSAALSAAAWPPPL